MMAIAWLRVAAFLLLSLLLARTVCSHIGGWIVWYVVQRDLWRHRPKGKRHELQVIVCGFPRTGTTSLKVAMEMLGLPCFHGSHLLNPATANLFIKAFKSGNPKCWEKLLDGYAAIADVPGTCGYKPLLSIFPNAKVILNVRDPSKWYASFSQTILRTIEGHDHTIFKILTPWGAKCNKTVFYKSFFNDKPEDKETCIKAYLQHIDEVKEEVPPNNLLIYDIEKEDGWSKLCVFLNIPIPKSPFPKINDSKAFMVFINRVARIYTMVLSLYVAFVACTLFYVV